MSFSLIEITICYLGITIRAPQGQGDKDWDMGAAGNYRERLSL
jgi:hypothetical protein